VGVPVVLLMNTVKIGPISHQRMMSFPVGSPLMVSVDKVFGCVRGKHIAGNIA